MAGMMEADQTVIGAVAAANGRGPARIAYHDRPGRDVTLEQAEAMLRELYAEHTSIFADLILHARDGIERTPPTTGRKSPNWQPFRGRSNG